VALTERKGNNNKLMRDEDRNSYTRRARDEAKKLWIGELDKTQQIAHFNSQRELQFNWQR
jgi:hypothetical protein